MLLTSSTNKSSPEIFISTFDRAQQEINDVSTREYDAPEKRFLHPLVFTKVVRRRQGCVHRAHCAARHYNAKQDYEERQNPERPQKPDPLKPNQEQQKQPNQQTEEGAQPLAQQPHVLSGRRRNGNETLRAPDALRIILVAGVDVSQHTIRLVQRLHLFFAAAFVGVPPRGHPLIQAL